MGPSDGLERQLLFCVAKALFPQTSSELDPKKLGKFDLADTGTTGGELLSATLVRTAAASKPGAEQQSISSSLFAKSGLKLSAMQKMVRYHVGKHPDRAAFSLVGDVVTNEDALLLVNELRWAYDPLTPELTTMEEADDLFSNVRRVRPQTPPTFSPSLTHEVHTHAAIRRIHTCRLHPCIIRSRSPATTRPSCSSSVPP